MPSPQQDPPINLKRPYVAALLAFLVPGAGHLYQGRVFKAGIYFFGIMLLFVWGMQIGHWQLMYRLDPMSEYENRPENSEAQSFDDLRYRWELNDQEGPSRERTRLHWPYIAQAPVGLFSILSFVQEERYYSPSNASLSPEFTGSEESVQGYLEYVDAQGAAHEFALTGTLTLSVGRGDFGREIQGTFKGTTEGRPITVETRGEVQAGRPIDADERREILCRVTAVDGNDVPGGDLTVWTERPWIDRFLVPPSNAEIQRLHGELGKKHTLAEVFTWIAGMLNVLAIWDAFAGPAYGYRLRRRKRTDEDETSDHSNGSSEKSTDAAAKSSSAATA